MAPSKPAPAPNVAPKVERSRFRALHRLWKHPLGEVNAATDATSGSRVLVTVLHSGSVVSDAVLEASRVAARTAAGITSVGIVKPVDVQRMADGRIALASEPFEGTPLTNVSRNQPMLANRAIAILRQVTRALGDAHRVGLVHGALSLGSVILRAKTERADTVVVTDFGLGALLDGDVAVLKEDAAMQPMSPERMSGMSRDLREDMYMLGCVAYTLLTGGPPFRTGTPEAVRRRHAIEDPMPILERMRGARSVSEALAAWVHRCLSKDPEDRFKDMAEVEAALCLAQIDSRVQTVWDDLPPPQVDRAIMARIHEGLVLPATRGTSPMVATTLPEFDDEVTIMRAPVHAPDMSAVTVRRFSPDEGTQAATLVAKSQVLPAAPGPTIDHARAALGLDDDTVADAALEGRGEETIQTIGPGADDTVNTAAAASDGETRADPALAELALGRPPSRPLESRDIGPDPSRQGEITVKGPVPVPPTPAPAAPPSSTPTLSGPFDPRPPSSTPTVPAPLAEAPALGDDEHTIVRERGLVETNPAPRRIGGSSGQGSTLHGMPPPPAALAAAAAAAARAAASDDAMAGAPASVAGSIAAPMISGDVGAPAESSPIIVATPSPAASQRPTITPESPTPIVNTPIALPIEEPPTIAKAPSVTIRPAPPPLHPSPPPPAVVAVVAPPVLPASAAPPWPSSPPQLTTTGAWPTSGSLTDMDTSMVAAVRSGRRGLWITLAVLAVAGLGIGGYVIATREPPATPVAQPSVSPPPTTVGTSKPPVVEDPAADMAATPNDLSAAGDRARKEGRASDAEALYQRAIVREPKHLGALLGLGQLRLDAGDAERAAGYFRRAVGAAPKNGDARIGLGDAMAKLGDTGEARKQYKKAKQYGHPAAAARLAAI